MKKALNLIIVMGRTKEICELHLKLMKNEIISQVKNGDIMPNSLLQLVISLELEKRIKSPKNC